jgi:hypothetical protein
MIYNKVYKVPTWIVINLPKEKAQKVADEIAMGGAHKVEWISNDFPITVNELARKGWSHEVDKKMPFKSSPDFLMVAASNHIKKSGQNKSLSGTPDVPVFKLNRTVSTGGDYVRIFDEILENEPAISLSHLFSVGELCHLANNKKQTFVSVGPVSEKALQKISDRVITVNVAENGIEIKGCPIDDKLYEALNYIVTTIE